MQVSEAVHILNSTIFRPGWRVSSRPAPRGEVSLELELDTVDTSYPGRDGTYTVPRPPEPMDFTVSPEAFRTVEELLHFVLQVINVLQEHEDREFLRVKSGGRYVAPFHPHTSSGQQAWRLAGERDTGRRLTELIESRQRRYQYV